MGKITDEDIILQRQIIKNPTPTLTLPLKGRGFYGVFSLYEGDFMGFSHFHGSFSNPSPFKGEVKRDFPPLQGEGQGGGGVGESMK